MPRRKRTEDDSGAETVKKTKCSNEINGREVRWECESDTQFEAYSPVMQEQICAGHEAGKSEVLLDAAKNVKLRILFDRSVQKNKITGWERRVRCALRKKADHANFWLWEWEDEHGKWNAYNATASVSLQDAQEAGKTSLALKVGGRNYTVKLNGAKPVQANDDTGVERSVRFRQSECKPLAAVVKTESKEMDEEDEEEAKPVRKSARGSAKSIKVEPGSGDPGTSEVNVKKEPEEKKPVSGKGKAKSGASKSPGAESPEKKVKTVVVKGKAPVDPECPKASSMHVYVEGDNIYDCMTNQTNLQNNNNKYYLMQLLEDDKSKRYAVWFRWGRVGKTGQNSLIACGPDLEEAKNVFCKKFQDKTRNDWLMRNKFVKVPGKYDLVKIDYGADQNDAANGSGDSVDGALADVKVPDSKLDKRIQELITLICDVKSMEDAVVEMKYDAKRAPLGKLTSEQIKAGYTALKKIEWCIQNNKLGAALIQACDEFYTRIPHAFGMQRPPVIRTGEEVQTKMDLLQALDDIEIAMKIIKRRTSNENPIDTRYSALKYELEPLDHADPDFKLVERYLQATHAPTHNQYNMQLLDVFEVNCLAENSAFKDYGNKMLLWHGSRLTNWMGILCQGLRIAPPEAPVTGYMFGKGVYFADVSSKSANYCYANKSHDTGLLLLCEVSMGNPVNLMAADINAAALPDFKKTHSVVGQGAMAPDPKDTLEPNSTKVPQGKLKPTGLKNPAGYTLNYNEYIVYDTSQIRMKYLVKIKFNFKY